MAVRSMTVVYVVLMLVLVSLIYEDSKCSNGSPCMLAEAAAAAPAKNQIRKLLHGEYEEEIFKGVGSLDSRYGKDVVGWEDLRQVPTGPDPLHHNGGGSKKPHTP